MKGKRFVAIFLVMFLMTTALLAGCGGSQAPANTGEAKENNEAPTQETEKKAGIPKGMKEVNGILMDDEQYLNLIGFEPESLDTTRSSISSAWEAQTLLFEGLTRVEMTEDGVEKIVPGMAEKWENNEDGTEFTFYLRDALWSDGVPVKAQDFEYAVKRLLDPKTASPYAWLLTPIIENGAAFNKGEASADEVGITAIDEKTLKFKLAKPVPYFMQLSYFIVMMPLRKDVVEKYGDAYGQEAEQIVSNGPFVIKEWVHENKLIFEKNQSYWDKDHVYIEKMQWNNVLEADARMQALLKGDIDAAVVFKREWEDKFKSMGDDFSFLTKTLAWQSWNVYNHNDRYFKNAKIRKAFSVAFDREEFNEVVFGGSRIPAENYIPDNIMIGDENYQDKNGNPKYVKKLSNDIKDPKALLIEGLKELGEDPDPAKMVVTYMPLGNTDIARKTGEFMQQSFKKNLGVDVKLEILQSNICYDKFDHGDFQIFDTGWIGDYDDPSTFLDLWHSRDGYYKIGFENEEYNRLIEEAAKSLDNDKRSELYKRAEEILIYEEAACGATVIGKRNTAVRSYLKNYEGFSFAKRNFVGVYTAGRK